jgi:hypothetical protein
LTTNDHDLESRTVTMIVPWSGGSPMFMFMPPDEDGKSAERSTASD